MIRRLMFGKKAFLGQLSHCCQWNEMPTVTLIYEEESCPGLMSHQTLYEGLFGPKEKEFIHVLVRLYVVNTSTTISS
jgi:hypothetical protein